MESLINRMEYYKKLSICKKVLKSIGEMHVPFVKDNYIELFYKGGRIYTVNVDTFKRIKQGLFQGKDKRILTGQLLTEVMYFTEEQYIQRYSKEQLQMIKGLQFMK